MELSYMYGLYGFAGLLGMVFVGVFVYYGCYIRNKAENRGTIYPIVEIPDDNLPPLPHSYALPKQELYGPTAPAPPSFSHPTDPTMPPPPPMPPLAAAMPAVTALGFPVVIVQSDGRSS